MNLAEQEINRIIERAEARMPRVRHLREARLEAALRKMLAAAPDPAPRAWCDGCSHPWCGRNRRARACDEAYRLLAEADHA